MLTQLKSLLLKIYHWAHDTPANKFVHQGENVVLSRGFVCSHPERVKLGSHIYVAHNAFWYTQGGLTIDDGTLLGPHLSIYTVNHNYLNAEAVPYDGMMILKPVHIKQNAWVGGNVQILPGVTIGEGAVIGAGSVVAKDIPDLAIAAGNPAKPFRMRDRESYETLKAAGKIYMLMKYRGELIHTEKPWT
jgi:maltose O-acetyltransferase